jgi:hypothetical protein
MAKLDIVKRIDGTSQCPLIVCTSSEISIHHSVGTSFSCNAQVIYVDS